MNDLEQASSPDELYRLTLASMLESYPCERAFVAYGLRKDGLATPRASHGILLESFFTSGELSLSTVRKVLADNKPLKALDAMQEPAFEARTSVILSGLRSMLCVPVPNNQGQAQGVLYLDHRSRRSVYSDKELTELTALAQAMGDKMERLQTAGQALPSQVEEWRQLRQRGLEDYHQERFEEAEVWLVAARESARVFGAASPELAKSSNELGQLYMRVGRLSESRPLLLEALEVLEARPGGDDLVACLNNVGCLEFYEHDFHRAELRLRQALALSRPEEMAPRRLCVLYNLGKMKARRNLPDEAEERLREASNLAPSVLGEDHPNTLRIRESYFRFLEGQPI